MQLGDVVVIGTFKCASDSFFNQLIIFNFSISHTTRQPRSDEVPGKDYFFESLEKFEMDIKMVRRDFNSSVTF